MLFAACSPGDDDESYSDDAQELAPATEPGAAVEPPTTVDFVPGAMAGVTGVVQIEPVGEDTRIRVQLVGLATGEHAWHIHGAACGSEGPIVVAITGTAEDQGIGEAIVADDSGAATATVTVPAYLLTREQLRSGSYSLHVHAQGGPAPGESVACADLKPSVAR
ncbi:MAG: CHRD domain-containing protein [Gemmatimonadetes bacterium]|nr:CHRD domain-containing protein [Gemmatimonadota bacterium]